MGGENFEAMLELGKETAEGGDGIEQDVGEQPNYTLARLDLGAHVGAISNFAVLWEAEWDGVDNGLG